MKKIRKTLSVLMAGIIAAAAGSMGANADTVQKIYTLSELQNMSKEEFLMLEDGNKTAQQCYDDVNYSDVNLVYNFNGSAYDSNYQPYYTECTLNKLLGIDTLNLNVISSVTETEDNYFSWVIYVADTSCTELEKTDENILNVAKAEYCINQIMEFHYLKNPLGDTPLINYGEADGNDKLNANDAAFIAKAIAEQRAEELPETADFNADGKISAFDCSKIAQFISAKTLAKSSGMLK